MKTVLIVVLIGAGIGIQLLCALGVLLMSNVFDRLHFTGPSSIGVVSIAAAVVIDQGATVGAVKAVLVAGLLVAINPVLTHVTARAARVRQFGHWVAMPSERTGE